MKEEIGSVALQNVTLPSGAFFERLEQAYSRYGEAEPDGANVEQSLSHRYMREMAQGSTRDGDGQFQVESYLHYHGEEIVKRFDASSYLYLTKMMDLHDIGVGRGGLDEAWKRFSGRRLLGLGISSDMLFPNWQAEEAVRAAAKNGVAACYEEIESEKGHDAFLIDFDQVDDYLRSFLQ